MRRVSQLNTVWQRSIRPSGEVDCPHSAQACAPLIFLMNIPPFIQIDPLTGALAAIAILYSIYALYYTRRQEQRNACFKLLELWTSDYYSQCRNEGWYELEALTSPIEMNDLYKTNRTLSNQIWVVAHFIDHLRSLHAHKVLDRRLAAVLFKDSAASWIDVFGDKVIWGSAQGFFDRKIKPLRNQL